MFRVPRSVFGDYHSEVRRIIINEVGYPNRISKNLGLKSQNYIFRKEITDRKTPFLFLGSLSEKV